MNSNEFREHGKAMVDFVADYMDNIHKLELFPDVEQGYLQQLLPNEPPFQPEPWSNIMNDVRSKIMPGITHWKHPNFHGYFPIASSFPSLLGEMLCNGLGIVGFAWTSSPACTELETIVLDWLGKMVGLPTQFLSDGKGSCGGGVIQSCASDCVMASLLSARADKMRQLSSNDEEVNNKFLTKLVAYCSVEAHSCMEKAAMVSFIQLRALQTDEHGSLRGETLRKAMEEDISKGLIPFYCGATLGTTSCCSYDNLVEIGPVCEEFGVWLHVDAAYAGSAFICPELRAPLKGIEKAKTFNFNANKFLLTNFDCSVMWVQDKFRFTRAFVVNPAYLEHTNSTKSIDYRHWGLPLSRRFRSLKLWFVIRTYGVEGLQKYIRRNCELAKYFETLVRGDSKFELCRPARLGLVCFRLKGSSNSLNKSLLYAINATRKVHLTPANRGDQYILRFCICAENTTEKDVDDDRNIKENHGQYR